MNRIVRITALPRDIETLRAEADRSGIRSMGHLVDEWSSGTERFDRPGEALLGAFDGDRLIGVGGVTTERDRSVRAMRMRRLYVLQAWRERGIGRLLAAEMMEWGLAHAPLLTCNARATPAAPLFWDAMGFARVTASNWTHELRGNASTS